VAPSPATVQDGTYKPLSRPLFIYVNGESLQRPEIAAFMQFYLENAPVLAGDVGYVASPDEAYTSDQEKLTAAVAGTGTPDSAAAGAEATPSS
jgi:phosphate transport system substrate-binding protein